MRENHTGLDADVLAAVLKDYAHEVKVLKRMIRKHGNHLTSTEFARIFLDARLVVQPNGETVAVWRRPRVRFLSSRFILSDPRRGEWGKWVHLMAILCGCGICKETEITGRYPEGYYSVEDE
jgi:hypothetical protein